MHRCGRFVKVLFKILQRYMPQGLAFKKIKNLKQKGKNMRLRKMKKEQRKTRNNLRAI
jgi:hypothetical protein